MLISNLKYTAILFILLLCFSNLWALGQKENTVEKADSRMAVTGETADKITFQEANGQIIEVPKNPQKTVVLLNSILDVWYMAGGTSMARVNGKINVPLEAMDLPVLGSFANLNMEMIMELEPELLIVSNTDYQRGVRDFFVSEGVPGISVDYATYDDFRVVMDLFTGLTGKRDIYDNLVVPIERNVQSIIDQVPEGKAPLVCILFATTRYVKVETEKTITGYFCKKLGADNIYENSVINGASRVELSLEYILEQDPDIIFVTTMGDVKKCKERIDMEIVSSDIWGGLEAVKNKRFIYLDKTYSIYKPNRFYPEAFKIIAQYLYPDTAFSLDEK